VALLWRHRCLGIWFAGTPADLVLVVLLLLLPLAVWAAPGETRTAYAFPRALIIAWNLAFFSAVVVHGRRSTAFRRLLAAGFIAAGAFIAVGALFGTRWETKVPVLSPILEALPRPLAGVFSGAQDGFSPNQLAGALLYVLPFALAWLSYEMRRRRWDSAALLAAACLVMGVVLVASQSRAGFAGLAAALLILLLWPRRWGRRLLLGGTVLGVAVVVFFPVTEFLVALDDTTKVQGAYGSLSISGRLEIWARAVAALRDFPLTGVGLGAFRAIVHAVYPLYLIPPDYDIAHAHNFFLQAGLDFGLFGLIAVVALYLLAAVQCSALWRTRLFAEHQAWGLGLLAALLGQAVYSLADAVAMGSKPNLLLWWLLGLIFGLTGSFVGRCQAGPAASAAPPTAVEDQARFLPSNK
jgi:putative inorganic carbon (HCO3(-)) transporter